ncbi:hypothetical protein Tco_1217585 [Tanacetum coccineum]
MNDSTLCSVTPAGADATFQYRLPQSEKVRRLRATLTFECLWLHTLHAKPWENEFESFSGQCLSEYIRQLILCPHEIQLYHSLFHLYSDEMMSDVDVFRPGVLDVVAAESYGTLVVTIQRDVIICKAMAGRCCSRELWTLLQQRAMRRILQNQDLLLDDILLLQDVPCFSTHHHTRQVSPYKST